MKIGFGYDSHRFMENRPLILAGVHIPSEKGLAGHSDADVLVHAFTCIFKEQRPDLARIDQTDM